MSRKSRIAFLLVGIGLVLVVALVLVLPGRNQVPTMPVPNGYTLLAQAAKGISGPKPQFRDADSAALEMSVASNAPSLALARKALEHESHVPWPVPSKSPPAQEQMQAHIADIGSLKTLSFAFLAEAEMFSRRGEWEETVAGIGDTLRLARATSRGGPIIDALVGLAIENAAVVEAETVVDKLPVAQAQHLARLLREHDESRQTEQQVLDNEAGYIRAIYGIKAGPLRLLTRSSLQKSEQSFKQRMKIQQQRTRALIERASTRSEGTP